MVEPAQIVKVMSSNEDPEKDLEEDPEEDPVEEPKSNAVMLPASEEDVEPVVELDPMEEVAPEPTVESVEESGPGWLVESEESSSHDYRLEWMAPTYVHRYPKSLIAPTLPPAVDVISSQSSSKFTVVPDINKPGPSRTTRVVISCDSSLEGNLDSPCCPDSPPS